MPGSSIRMKLGRTNWPKNCIAGIIMKVYDISCSAVGDPFDIGIIKEKFDLPIG